MPMGNTLKLEDLLKPDCLPDESAGGENWRILHGDTLKLVKGFQPGDFDAVVTDPPYASGEPSRMNATAPPTRSTAA